MTLLQCYKQNNHLTKIFFSSNTVLIRPNYTLQDHDNILKIYIYAPYEARMRNCVDILKMKPDAAKKMISDVDKARASYHKHYAGYLPGDYEHMDFTINSASLGIDHSAEVIRDIVLKKFGDMM